MPFTLIAENLVSALKEDLISELIIMTSFKKGKHPPGGNVNKRKKFERSFGKFSNCEIHSIEVTPDPVERGKYYPYR